MSALRRFLRGWSAHTNGIFKQKKAHFQQTTDSLDIAAEARLLWDLDFFLINRGIISQAYFMKRRLNETLWTTKENPFSLDETITEDMAQVTQVENNFLTALFSEEELKEAIFAMEHNKAPGGVRKKLDYLRSMFYWKGDGHKKKYQLAKWDIICPPKDQRGLGIRDLERTTQNTTSSSDENGEQWRRLLGGGSAGEQWRPAETQAGAEAAVVSRPPLRGLG
nr:hypothetical protein [Oryza sativa Japonica Group]